MSTPPPTPPTPPPPPSTNGDSKSLFDLMDTVLNNTSSGEKEKIRLLKELRKSSPASDRWTFRIAIVLLGLMALLTIVIMWVLSYYMIDIPDGLTAIGSGAAGGVAGLLSPGRNEAETETIN